MLRKKLNNKNNGRGGEKKKPERRKERARKKEIEREDRERQRTKSLKKTVELFSIVLVSINIFQRAVSSSGRPLCNWHHGTSVRHAVISWTSAGSRAGAPAISLAYHHHLVEVLLNIIHTG